MMNRRNFLGNLTAVGVGSAVLPAACSRSSEKGQTSVEINFHPVPFGNSTVIKSLDNKWLKVEVHEDASVRIIDKINNAEWQMGPVALQENNEIEIGAVWLRTERSMCEQFPGRFRVEQSGSDLKYTLLDNLGSIKGTFKCNVVLEEEWLSFIVSDIENNLPSLVFPTPLQSDELIIPNGVGKIYSKPLDKCYAWTYYSHITMRWFGGQKAGNAWIGIVEDSWADSGLLATQLAVSIAWYKSLGKWEGKKKVKFKFIKGNYVDLSKIYRGWAKTNLGFRTLEEKKKILPALKNLEGGRYVSFHQAHPRKIRYEYENRFNPVPENIADLEKKPDVFMTHKEVKAAMQKCKDKGMKKGLFMTHGWINNGYDGSYPDIWPPEPALGSIDELKDLCKENDPFFFGMHDNYQDMYSYVPSFPKGINITKEGELMRGGFWAGGQAYILNSKNSLEYAKRNWENIKEAGFKAMYVDTITTSQLNQSYEKGNTQTRLQDFDLKKDILKFFFEKGIVLSSEQVGEQGVPYNGWQCTFYERESGETIPLWQLVYHDCHYTSRAVRYNPDMKLIKEHILTDMLYGNILHFYLNVQNWTKAQDTWINSGMDIFSKTFYAEEWHEQIGSAELISHRFVTDDRNVEETVFGNGKSIICNFGDKPVTVNNKKIAAGGFLIS